VNESYLKNLNGSLEPADASDEALNDDIGEALTDDERIRREPPTQGDGPRVTPGPADLERLPNT
jgi:hypothetical protein